MAVSAAVRPSVVMCERRWKTLVRARGVVFGEWETKRNEIFILDY